ncbi:MAG: 4-hydroxybenzoate octaprenyltransferase [Micavibrio aeruginosavorus]|nr:4-hydroxybenzoate octaprenyltransferase [Micavibrio aeruginosavorus]
MTHTDINMKGWTGRLPAAMRPYALLMRLDRPIGAWLLLLPGWWAIMMAAGGALSMNAGDVFVLALFGIGAVIMRGAGCIVNDLWDRRLDSMVERTRTRPLASGQVSPRQALAFLFILLLLGLSILLQMNITTVLLGVLSMIFVVLYPAMKRITWWPQAFLGLTFNFGALMGWAAVTGTVSLPALLLYIAGIFWTLGYDTVYAHQDMEDDARIGVKSTALRLGKKSRIWVARFYAAAWLLMVTAFTLAHAANAALFFLGVGGWHLWWQIRTWSPDDPASSLRIFKSNRDFGFLILLAAAVSGFFW